MFLSKALCAELETRARSFLGNAFCITEVSPAGAGIHTALRLSGPHGAVFAKLRAAGEAAVCEAEAADLAAIACHSAYRVPAVIDIVKCDHAVVLMLEWLDLRPITDDSVARRAGEALAALHAQHGDCFGWPHDNYLGHTLQRNTPSDHWARFFLQQRLQPILARAAALGYKGELQRHGERILASATALFLEYRPAPSLLHGDLWSGNIAALADGSPVLYDPASYYGDREADFAMTELFGGLPLPFYAAYRSLAPLNEGYERRKTLYNLYHIVNHLCLFGKGYLRQAERMAAGLVIELTR